SASTPRARPASASRPLGPTRAASQRASSPRPHARDQPAPSTALPRPLGHSASCAANTLLPQPHAQPTRCLGHSASCAASTLPYCFAASLPRLLGLVRSQQAASLPRLLGLMRS
ncbi:unnamed protein product, partial [Musa banksii]